MKILSHKQIGNKIDRIATQILENNLDSEEIHFAGINTTGYKFAEMIINSLKELSDQKIFLERLKLSPQNPLEKPVEYSGNITSLESKTLIIVDDVINSGRTIYFALQPFLHILTKKVEVAVLVERSYSSFPVKADYVGLSLATTMTDNIEVKIDEVNKIEAFVL